MKVWLMCFVCAAALGACSDDPSEPVSAFSNKAEALATEDAKSGGVYKGVIVGSSGFFSVVLQKGLKVVNVTLDGESRSLATTSIPDWITGEPIKNAVFVSGDWQATFSVGADGGKPSISFTIPGHTDVQVSLIKELSNAVVRVYEGSYLGTSSGTWNFVIQGPALTGVSRNDTGTGSLEFFGLVDGNNVVITTPVTGKGTIAVDNVTGTWSDANSGSGTWKGKRIL